MTIGPLPMMRTDLIEGSSGIELANKFRTKLMELPLGANEMGKWPSIGNVLYLGRATESIWSGHTSTNFL